MNGTSDFQEVRSSPPPPDHLRIGSCTSSTIDSEQVLGAFSALKISSFSPRASAQSEKRFLTPFSCLKHFIVVFIVAGSVIAFNGSGLLLAADVCSSTSGLLDISPVLQQEDVWCFAASANAVLNHLGVLAPQSTSNPPGLFTQCQLYNIAKNPTTDCCSVSHPTGVSECKRVGWPDEVFDQLNLQINPQITYTANGAQSWIHVKDQICPGGVPGQPFIYVATPPNGIPHTYTAKGFNESGPNGQQVLYVDSHVSLGDIAIGASIVDYVCYYQGACPNVIYSHDGDYYDFRQVLRPDIKPPEPPAGFIIR